MRWCFGHADEFQWHHGTDDPGDQWPPGLRLFRSFGLIQLDHFYRMDEQYFRIMSFISGISNLEDWQHGLRPSIFPLTMSQLSDSKLSLMRKISNVLFKKRIINELACGLAECHVKPQLLLTGPSVFIFQWSGLRDFDHSVIELMPIVQRVIHQNLETLPKKDFPTEKRSPIFFHLEIINHFYKFHAEWSVAKPLFGSHF
jgi:hypothetical protein